MATTQRNGAGHGPYCTGDKGKLTTTSTLGERGLLGYLISTLLRLGFVATLAFAGINLAVALASRNAAGLGFSWYSQNEYGQANTPGIPSPHPAGLSDYEVARLLDGQNGEYSLTARFHGYPAPTDVLLLAEELMLSPEQIGQVESVQTAAQESARQLGREILYLEAQLGSAFGDHLSAVSPDYLHQQAERVGRLYGKLRATHLESYVSTARILSSEQLSEYSRLRGDEERAFE